MFGGKRALGLDVGESTVKLVELKMEGGQIHLAHVDRIELAITPDANKEGRKRAIGDAVSELFKRLPGKKIAVAIATPGQSVFTRYVKLPPVPDSKLGQIIGYEAQQQVPFPLEEVIWDYQRLPSKDPSQTNVLLVAIKSSLVDELLSEIAPAQVEPVVIDHSSLASYNSLKFNGETKESEVSVFLDMGGRATNLSIEREGQLCWTRSVPIGGNHCTQAIQKEFNLGFREAERLKQSKGLIYLDEGQEGGDEVDQKLSEVIISVIEELVFEIQRSIGYFRSQLEGRSINRMMLSGGCARLPGLDKFLEARLGISVSIVNPLKKVVCKPEVLSSWEKDTSLTVAVGLALRTLLPCAVEINLLPELLVKKQEFRQKRPYLFASALLVVMILVLITVSASRECRAKRVVLEELQMKLKDYRNYDKQVNEAKRAEEEVERKLNVVGKLVDRRFFWPKVLLEISRLIPREIWLTDFITDVEEENPGFLEDVMMEEEEKARVEKSVNSDVKVVEVNGIAPGRSVINDFIIRIEESPHFIKTKIIRSVEIMVTGKGEVVTEKARRRTREPARGRLPDKRSGIEGDWEGKLQTMFDFSLLIAVKEEI